MSTLKSGEMVVLIALPPGLLDGLPADDQRAITAIVGICLPIPRTDTVIMHTLVFLIVLAASQPKAACKPQFAPLNTGSYSGDSRIPFWPKEEGSKWQGDGWIGWKAFGDSLEPVRLTIINRPKEETDDYVTVQIVPDVTYAVRCMPSVRAGRIHNVGIANHELRFNGPLKIPLGKPHFAVSYRSTPSVFSART